MSMREAYGSRRRAAVAQVCAIAASLAFLSLPAVVRGDDTGIDEMISRMDRLWVERERGGTMYDLVTLGVLAQSIDPQSYETQWRTARAAFWVARTQTNRFVKKAWAVRAKDLADRATTMAPARVEGHYFSAVALGEYATTTGIIKAVREGLVGKIESAGLKAYELDRDFDSGAPIAVLGRFYFMLPWPKRDLPRSRTLLEELRDRHPNVLIGRYYLAETLHELGEDPAARQELEFVIAHAASDDPEAPDALAKSALRDWY